MEDPDALLAAALRDWVASLPAGTASLSPVAPAAGGGGGFLVTPTRSGAVAIQLWVGDLREQLSIRVGSAARWDHLPLSAKGVEKLCASVAFGGFLDETLQWGSFTLARRASLVVPGGSTLRWGTWSPFLLIPGARWVRRTPEPWVA